MPTRDENEWKMFIKQQTPVNIIRHNCRTGYKEYVIHPVTDHEFWIEAFNTLKDARAFCKKYKLPIKLQRKTNGSVNK